MTFMNVAIILSLEYMKEYTLVSHKNEKGQISNHADLA